MGEMTLYPLYPTSRLGWLQDPPEGEPSTREDAPGMRCDLDFSFHRSFEPILRLLPQGISPVSQHWATWALYNLVSVYREYPLVLCSDAGTLPWLQAGLSSGSL